MLVIVNCKRNIKYVSTIDRRDDENMPELACLF